MSPFVRLLLVFDFGRGASTPGRCTDHLLANRGDLQYHPSAAPFLLLRPVITPKPQNPLDVRHSRNISDQTTQV